MRALIQELQRTAARWRAEHAQAADTAHTLNLRLARGVAPAVASISLNAVAASAERSIATSGVTAVELPTITGKRESEV